MEKREILNTLAFLHQKLLTTSFYPEEFKEADKALNLIHDMAVKLDTEIMNESKVVADEVVSEQA